MDSSTPPVEPLDPALVQAALGPNAGRFRLEFLGQCPSTNDVLTKRAERGAPSGTVVACELQTAGRGRRGRTWHSRPAASLTFSLLWRFPHHRALTGLSLAVGVALVRALEGQGAAGVGLKWPNDVLGAGRKLAGVLIETVGGVDPAAIIGIGINLQLPRDLADQIPADAIALADLLPFAPARNLVLAAILSELATTLELFERDGFAALRAEWMERNDHAGCEVRVLTERGEGQAGVCLGVDADGALLIRTSTGVERVVSGDVSLRPR